jgi:hypothetical protein
VTATVGINAKMPVAMAEAPGRRIKCNNNNVSFHKQVMNTKELDKEPSKSPGGIIQAIACTKKIMHVINVKM